jgi:hypothetical protein
VRDIGKRSAVNDGRVVLQRLHQVRLDGVLQQRRHRAVSLQIGGADRFLVAGVADDDPGQPLLQVAPRGGQAEDGHDLGRHDDVETILAWKPVGRATECDHRRAQRPVVHVDDAAPHDAPQIKPQRVAVVDVVVDQRRQQVVRQGNCVEIAGEVQVDVFHRHHLRMAAARSPALHAEHRPQRGLAQRDHAALADAIQRVAQAHHGGGLALARRRRADRRHQHQLAARPALLVQQGEVDLRLVVPVRLHRGCWNPEAFKCHGQDGFERCRLGNLDIGKSHPWVRWEAGRGRHCHPARANSLRTAAPAPRGSQA